MLKLKRLVMEDFGPFKDRQYLEFPSNGGVSVIYGENMRGKTTLLNALRYALFGTTITRGDNKVAIHLIGNWEKAREGHFGFKVELEFEYDDHQYILTRECKLRDGVNSPTDSGDYIQLFFLKKDGDVLGPHVAEAELSRVMPEKVSRFFLFDGELLQQYEELLRNESTMGEQIKEAIERILGVPVLTNTRSHLAGLLQQAQRKESKAAQRNQKTQELGSHLSAQIALRDAHESEIVRLNKELEGSKEEKVSQENQIRKNQKLRALLQQRDHLHAEIEDIKRQITEKEERRRDIMADAWRWVLMPRILIIREGLEKELSGLKAQQTRKNISEETLAKIFEGLHKGQCPTCLQALTTEAERHIKATLVFLKSEAEEEDVSEKIQQLMLRIQGLKESESQSKKDLLDEINDAIDELVVSRATQQDLIREIEDQTKDLDEAELRKLYSDYDKVIKKITLIGEGIGSEKQKKDECNQNIRKIQDKLSNTAGASLTQERHLREMYEKLQEIFNQGVAAYRERLRAKVENDATNLFRKLTSEPDYKSLRINENYGLTIIHKDETKIPVRSAGAEHIVALSLMGALQRNAPLQGPIIMDSPFGRLDEIHTTKVIEALPTMANQVILLVYERELEPKMARGHLLGNLKSEYKITRKSARHSLLEKYVGA
ncbi:MAG: AAA family ATPase [Desulfarculaceae bacterium]|nr:AAA family ATPase [Desulfarculaceae bacterium]